MEGDRDRNVETRERWREIEIWRLERDGEREMPTANCQLAKASQSPAVGGVDASDSPKKFKRAPSFGTILPPQHLLNQTLGRSSS